MLLTMLVLGFMMLRGLLVQAISIDESCIARSTLVATSDSFSYRPYFATVKRCSGSYQSYAPNRIACVADKSDNLDIQVRAVLTGEITTVTLSNHVSCKGQCNVSCEGDSVLDSRSCLCRCPRQKTCDIDKEWSNSACSCVCRGGPAKCAGDRRWNPRTCSCSCEPDLILRCSSSMTHFDLKACKCTNIGYGVTSYEYNSQENRTNMWMLIGIAALMLTLVVYEMYMCSRQSGISYHLVKKISELGSSWKIRQNKKKVLLPKDEDSQPRTSN